MGGKALLEKHPGIKRLTRDEFAMISNELVQKFRGLFRNYNTEIRVLPTYSDKTSFGDVDFIVDASRLPQGIDGDNWKQMIIQHFKPKAVVENGNIFSFEYKNHQIDIISVISNNYAFSFQYYSYNGMGSLMGNVAKAMGLKLTETGLYLPVYQGQQKIEDILITNDWGQMSSVLGYGSNRYGYSFDRLSSILSYLSSCVYFSQELYNVETMNADERGSYGNLPIYKDFVEYITAHKATLKNYNFESSPKPWMSLIKTSFPQVVDRSKELMEILAKERIFKQKFNGEVIMAATGITEGKGLGKFIEAFKKSFPGPLEFDIFIMSSLPSTIEEKLKAFQEEYVKTLKVETSIGKLTAVKDLSKEPRLDKNPNFRIDSNPVSESDHIREILLEQITLEYEDERASTLQARQLVEVVTELPSSPPPPLAAIPRAPRPPRPMVALEAIDVPSQEEAEEIVRELQSRS
jgi:hypothetical protein